MFHSRRVNLLLRDPFFFVWCVLKLVMFVDSLYVDFTMEYVYLLVGPVLFSCYIFSFY